MPKGGEQLHIIEYHRESGELVRLEKSEPAQRRHTEEHRLRVKLERLKTGASRKVVFLEASRHDALRKTPGRHFERLDELLTRALAAAA